MSIGFLIFFFKFGLKWGFGKWDSKARRFKSLSENGMRQKKKAVATN